MVRFDAILLEAKGRPQLVRLLAAARRGGHIGRPGVRRILARRAELLEPLPLVADSAALGTTTATVTVVRGRLRVTVPRRLESRSTGTNSVPVARA